jgi:hypothetical protein
MSRVRVIASLLPGWTLHAVLLGAALGAFVAYDPSITAYLLRDFYSLRHVPYALSIALALAVGLWYAVRAFAPGLLAAVIQDYYMVFPVIFLLAYQLNGVAFGALDPTEAVIAVFAALFLAGLFIRRDQYFVASPFNMLHLALVVCIFLSLASELKPFSFLKSFKPFVVFFLLVNFLPRGNLIRTFLRWLLILAMLSGVLCIVQELAWILFQEILSVVPKAQLMRMFEDTPIGPIFRVPGLMISYRSMALYQATALVLAFSALLWPHDGKPLLPRFWLYVAVLLSATTVGLTVAKDILLGLSAALVLLLLLFRPLLFGPLFAVGTLAGALGLAAVTVITPGGIDTAVDLTRTVPKSEIERIRVDRDSIQWIMHGPYTWTGRGVGAGPRYTAHHLRWPAHNAFILVASELGLLGLFVLVLIYGLAIVRAAMLCILIRAGPYVPVSRAFLAILIVIMAGAQFEASYLDIYVWTIFAAIESVWFLVRHQSALDDPQPHAVPA